MWGHKDFAISGRGATSRFFPNIPKVVAQILPKHEGENPDLISANTVFSFTITVIRICNND